MQPVQGATHQLAKAWPHYDVILGPAARQSLVRSTAGCLVKQRMRVSVSAQNPIPPREVQGPAQARRTLLHVQHYVSVDTT